MNERDFIDLLRPLAGPAGLNLDDDAALYRTPLGQDLVLSKDTMVEGVHFPNGRIGGGFSERLLRTALSDLAAKGARPTAYMVSVAWPRDRDRHWVTGFVQGLHDAQSSFDCYLIGGDTVSTTGPLVASATVFGVVPTGEMIHRRGAKIGDDVWYTGVLGRAEKGLKIVMGFMSDPVLDGLDGLELSFCEEAYLRPEPRFLFRKILRKYATACADISDGLFNEAKHIADASEVCLNLTSVKNASFGDDYELLFTAPISSRNQIQLEAKNINLPVTICGTVVSGGGVQMNGESVVNIGYRHSL